MANKKKEKNSTRKIPVFKVEEKRDNQVKSLSDYKPAIAKMYQDEAGKPLDLTKLDKRKKRKKITYLKIIAVLLLLLAVTLAGFFVFFRDKKFKEGDVILTISGAESIASGEEATITVKYQNQGQAFLGNLELSLTYPDGFTYKNSEPEADNTYNQYWKLGNLGVGKAGEVKITGQITGEVGAAKSFTAKLSYKPSNFNATFTTEASFSGTITSSIISLDIEGAKNVIPDKEVSYKIKYKNEATEALEKIRIIAVYPEGFTPGSASPDFSEGKNTWQIDRLEAGNTGEIEIKGEFSGEAGDLKELKIRVGLLDLDGDFSPQVEKSLLVLLISPELNLTEKINDSDQNQAVNLGDTLTYYLLYKNNSDLEITDLSVSTELDSELLDLESLSDEFNGKIKEDTITWTKEQISGLASLKPGDEGEISFKINLKDKLALSGSEDKNFQVESKFKAKSVSLESLGGGSLEVESNTIMLKINSQVSLEGEARYYSEENEALGSGPLPPQAGKTTAYRIFWYLTNTSNELDTVTVVATLPEDIYWTGQNKSVSAGNLTFNAATRQVTWSVNKVPVGSGQILPQLFASFEVSLTPKTADVGYIKILIDKTSLTATDSFTQASLSASADSLTTDLKSDISAQGKGTVAESQL
ncbi:MAG: hypothetical protein ABIH38_05205 [Patescibacteria group bacterium]